MTQFFFWQSALTRARDDGRLGRLRRGRPFVPQDWSRYVQVVVLARRPRGWSRVQTSRLFLFLPRCAMTAIGRRTTGRPPPTANRSTTLLWPPRQPLRCRRHARHAAAPVAALLEACAGSMCATRRPAGVSAVAGQMRPCNTSRRFWIAAATASWPTGTIANTSSASL